MEKLQLKNAKLILLVSVIGFTFIISCSKNPSITTKANPPVSPIVGIWLFSKNYLSGSLQANPPYQIYSIYTADGQWKDSTSTTVGKPVSYSYSLVPYKGLYIIITANNFNDTIIQLDAHNLVYRSGTGSQITYWTK